MKPYTGPKTIHLVYGEMGAGKSYKGRWLAQQLGADFIEGDDLMPDDMRARVDSFLPPTFEQIDELLYRLFTAAEASPRANVVVAQALYNAKHRSMLIRWWQKMGYEVLVYRAEAGFWRNLKQLWRREKGLRWVLFWLASKPWFQPDTGDKFDKVLP